MLRMLCAKSRRGSSLTFGGAEPRRSKNEEAGTESASRHDRPAAAHARVGIGSPLHLRARFFQRQFVEFPRRRHHLVGRAEMQLGELAQRPRAEALDDRVRLCFHLRARTLLELVAEFLGLLSPKKAIAAQEHCAAH